MTSTDADLNMFIADTVDGAYAVVRCAATYPEAGPWTVYGKYPSRKTAQAVAEAMAYAYALGKAHAQPAVR